MEGGVKKHRGKCRIQKVCNSEDSGLNDVLKLARRVENDGVVASAVLELSGRWATTATTLRESAAVCCTISEFGAKISQNFLVPPAAAVGRSDF